MPIREPDESWPFIEQFKPDRAAEHQVKEVKGHDLTHMDGAVYNEEGALVARRQCVPKVTAPIGPDPLEPEPTRPRLEALQGGV